MKPFKTYDEQIDKLSDVGLLPKYINTPTGPNINGPVWITIHNPFKKDVTERAIRMHALQHSKAYGPFDGDSIINYQEPYLNSNNYTHSLKTKDHKLKHILLINRLKKLYKDTTYKPFNHYRSAHGHIPIWIFINKLTFGEMLHFYEVLKIQNNISCYF